MGLGKEAPGEGKWVAAHRGGQGCRRSSSGVSAQKPTGWEHRRAERGFGKELG